MTQVNEELVGKGYAAFSAGFGQLGELSGGTFRVELQSVRSEGEDKVVAENTTIADRNGKHLGSSETIVFTIADGQVVDGAVTPADQAAFDAFWD